MSTHIYSSEEINRLSKNPYIEKCTAKSITYTCKFKKRVLEQHAQGVSSRDIWRRAGFDISGWKNDYTKDCLKNWKKTVNRAEIEGLWHHDLNNRGYFSLNVTLAYSFTQGFLCCIYHMDTGCPCGFISDVERAKQKSNLFCFRETLFSLENKKCSCGAEELIYGIPNILHSFGRVKDYFYSSLTRLNIGQYRVVSATLLYE
ncbi:MAG: hypothetical protein UY07_C0021G0012 [Parcubacteria group bacterium GW2011_GWA1_47_8]|nr:MAG: hypothetical protein UY07_C0021G0012 [Parcubacteria group bacterium GW2011_GWA1_47_8]KKW08052.1 MAG: hypothetical protein UY42_C0001G0015 [Parcubacteria group bacterium GW2011_GWA2_49_16]